MNAASIFGRIIPAIFAPKLGVFNLLIVLTVCESALLYSIVAVESGGAMIAFAIIYGFISGGGKLVSHLPEWCLTHRISRRYSHTGYTWFVFCISVRRFVSFPPKPHLPKMWTKLEPGSASHLLLLVTNFPLTHPP